MVRVNLINPGRLTDQHLVAEYVEILMLMAYIRKHQECKKDDPGSYCLGKGHMSFFRNKVGYLRKRHGLIKEEMRRRGFKAEKSLDVRSIRKALMNDWQPSQAELRVISSRIKQKISLKPDWYRYYGKRKPKKFLMGLVTKTN